MSSILIEGTCFNKNMIPLVFEGNVEKSLEYAKRHTENVLKVSLLGNPDVSFFIREEMKREDTLSIHKNALRAPFGEKNILFLSFHRATKSAQNSLLKILEEPPEMTHIFLIIPHRTILLPTVQSRILIYEYTETKEETKGEDKEKEFFSTQKFLSSSLKDRAEMVKKLCALYEKNHQKSVLKKYIEEMEEVFTSLSVEKNASALSSILFVEKYISDSGSSPKMLFDYLSVLLPRIK
jgi:hypothetical protein